MVLEDDMTTVVFMSSVTASVFGGLDHWVWRQFVQRHFLSSAAKLFTDLGTMTVLVPMAFIAGVALWWTYRFIALAVVPWIALQLNSSLVAVLKRTFDVARPPKAHWLAGAAGGSFPSGHTANTTCLLAAVATIIVLRDGDQTRRRVAVVVAGIGSFVMGWTRLALNVHWLSDVVFGWCVGGATAVALSVMTHRVIQNRMSPNSDKSHT